MAEVEEKIDDEVTVQVTPSEVDSKKTEEAVNEANEEANTIAPSSETSEPVQEVKEESNMVDDVEVKTDSTGVTPPPSKTNSSTSIDIEAPPVKSENISTQPANDDYPPDASFSCLMFHTESNGELFMKWSDTPLPGSLAIFTTTKKIPPFKFKKQIDLLNNIGGNRKKFMTGLASFFKEADAYDGVFQILDDSEVGFGDVWVSVGGKKWGKEAGVPRKLKLGERVDINSIEALVILPHASAVFNGILKIDIGRFVNTGIREGAAWHRS